VHAVHREQVMSLRGATKIIAFSASDSAPLRRRNSSSGNVGLCKYPLQTMRLVATVQAPGSAEHLTNCSGVWMPENALYGRCIDFIFYLKELL
jgi:hypothetical protein